MLFSNALFKKKDSPLPQLMVAGVNLIFGMLSGTRISR